MERKWKAVIISAFWNEEWAAPQLHWTWMASCKRSVQLLFDISCYRSVHFTILKSNDPYLEFFWYRHYFSYFGIIIRFRMNIWMWEFVLVCNIMSVSANNSPHPGAWDKSAVIYNVLDLKPLFRLSVAHSLPVTCVRWLDRDLVTCSADRSAALWNTSNGERATLFSGKRTHLLISDKILEFEGFISYN
jgi:WD40 repeat protein